MGTGELCVNPLAVISDNIITPVEEFDLAPIRTQIPGQTRRAGRAGWGGGEEDVFDVFAFAERIYKQSPQRGRLKVVGRAPHMHGINLLWIKI